MDEAPELRLLFHRLNNQLGIILAHAELLEAKAADDANRARAAQVVSSALDASPGNVCVSSVRSLFAPGLRMMFECWLQLRGEAPPERRIASLDAGRKLALTHNLGGQPGECVSFVSVVGTEPGA